jgi:acyl-lipid omega-6 desaturase (Delta-12 desaturase)
MVYQHDSFGANHGFTVNIQVQLQFSSGEREQAKRLTAYCRNFCEANDRTGAFQCATTLAAFFALIAAMFWLSSYSFWLTFILGVPAGATLMRLFALQHDCGHGSLFGARRANEAMGKFISLLTFTPYDHWRRSHALHHQLSGNLDKRGFGDIATLTVNEYSALRTFGRFRYRLYRHPVILLVLGPPLFFLILQRLAIGSNLPARDSLPGILMHNTALLAVYGALTYAMGWQAMLTVMVPTYLTATWIGGWLFFVQHQFEDAHWDQGDSWDMKIAAIKGSSQLMLPRFMSWMTCNIDIHHIHHLCSKIPNYRLRECLEGNLELQEVAPKLSILDGLKSTRLALWDEASRRLISFREFTQRERLAAA